MKKKRSEDSSKIGGTPKFIYVLVGLVIVFLIVVQVLFSLPASSELFRAKWEAGDLLAFVGTMALGLITVQQTWKANAMSQRLMDLEENRCKLETRPFIMAEDWAAEPGDPEKILHPNEKNIAYVNVIASQDPLDNLCVKLRVVNTTQAFETVSYDGAAYARKKQELPWIHSYTNVTNPKLRLQPGEGGDFVFWGARLELEDSIKNEFIRFRFLLENRFGERYQENFEALAILRERHGEGEAPFLSLAVQDYRIGRFVKKGSGTELVWEEAR